jgi:hypothetical protein
MLPPAVVIRMRQITGAGRLRNYALCSLEAVLLVCRPHIRIALGHFHRGTTPASELSYPVEVSVSVSVSESLPPSAEDETESSCADALSSGSDSAARAR